MVDGQWVMIDKRDGIRCRCRGNLRGFLTHHPSSITHCQVKDLFPDSL